MCRNELHLPIPLSAIAITWRLPLVRRDEADWIQMPAPTDALAIPRAAQPTNDAGTSSAWQTSLIMFCTITGNAVSGNSAGIFSGCICSSPTELPCQLLTRIEEHLRVEEVSDLPLTSGGAGSVRRSHELTFIPKQLSIGA